MQKKWMRVWVWTCLALAACTTPEPPNEKDAGTIEDAAVADACVVPVSIQESDCDVMAQDCGCGLRCVLWAGPNTNWLEQGCGAVLGSAGDGEACSWVNHLPGQDTCLAGYYCSNLGRPATPPGFMTCHALCVSDADCDSGEFCMKGTTAPPMAGYCTLKCDPFADACPPNEGCTQFDDVNGLGQLACDEPLGTKTEGQACAGNAECAANLQCAGGTGNWACRSFCDDTHACTTGTCRPISGTSYKLCLP